VCLKARGKAGYDSVTKAPPVIPAVNQFLLIWTRKSKIIAWDASRASAPLATVNKVPYPAWPAKTTCLRWILDTGQWKLICKISKVS